jgi:transcriptional regulator with XRE-family HTH domain
MGIRGREVKELTNELSRQPTLGEVIRWHRHQKGWTQAELVLKLDGTLDQGQLSRLEGNTLKTPRIEALRKLGEVLGVPPGRLLKLSRFPGAPILSESLEEALVDLPTECYDVFEQLVRMAAGVVHPREISPEGRKAITEFLCDLGLQTWENSNAAA